MNRLLIKNGNILVFEDDNAIIKKQDVLIENNKITSIEDEIICSEADFIDAKNCIVTPGLMNMHTHMPMKLLQSIGDGKELMDWLLNYIVPIERTLTDNDIYVSTKMALLEMVKGGTTFFNEMYFPEETIAKAAQELGIRGIISNGTISFEIDSNLEKNVIDKYKSSMIKYADNELIDIGLSIHQLCDIDIKIFKSLLEEFRGVTKYCHIHLAETKGNSKKCYDNNLKTPMCALLDCDTSGYRVLAAHSVHVDSKEIKKMKKKDVFPIYNPCSNAKLASGVAPVREYIKNGINVCLGTDGSSSNDNLNMIEEMKFGSLMQRVANQDATTCSAGEMIKMATSNAAKAIDRADLGNIKEGNTADIAIFPLDTITMLPCNDVLSQLVFGSSGLDAKHVIINGKIIIKDFELKSADENQIIADFKNLVIKKGNSEIYK